MSTVNLRDAALNKTYTYTEDRRTKFYRRYLMYNDDYKSIANYRLTEIYTQAATLRLDKQMDLTNNIFKTIVNAISRVYSFGVSRETTNEAMQELIDSGLIDKTMKQANRYVNALNDVLLQVSWNEKLNKPKLIFRLPHKTEVKLDDDDNLIEVEYFVSKDKVGKEKWAFWSETEHYYKIYDKTNDDFTKEYPEGNENGINPFGELLFIPFQNGFRDGVFWDTKTGDDLFEMTIDNCIYNTFKNYMIKWQSFKQLVITGKTVDGIGGQVLDPSTALTIKGEDIGFNILDLQANIKELGETIDSNANKVAINYNISPNQFRLTGQVSSGFALKMENTKLDEFTKDQQKDFLGYEKELFRMIEIVSGVYSGNYKNDLTITINAPTYSESRQDTLNNYEKAITLGIKSPIDIIMSEQDVDEVEAKRIYDENIALRNQMNNKLNQGTLNLDTTATALSQANG